MFGEQDAAGSNPVTPTSVSALMGTHFFECFAVKKGQRSFENMPK